jgi:putative ABC transport system permease protein
LWSAAWLIVLYAGAEAIRGRHDRSLAELGLLRAVAQTRRRTRSMIRWESVMLAGFGTLGESDWGPSSPGRW